MGGLLSTPEAPAPIVTPPAEAPAPVEEATLEEFSDEETQKAKKKAVTQGTKTLQIPLGGASGGATVGTGG